MTTSMRKTYRGINLEMLFHEIRDLVQRWGVIAGDARVQTYGLPSGLTQSRVTLAFKTQVEGQTESIECGNAHIISSPMGDTKVILYLDENILPKEKITALQEDLNFILGAYEVRW